MTADHDLDLDARLLAARGFADDAVPAVLPVGFLHHLRACDPAGADDTGEPSALRTSSHSRTPVSALAAQQLVNDAHRRRRRPLPRRRARRTTVVLASAAVAAACTWITAATLASPGSPASHTDGRTHPAEVGQLGLASAESLTFPLSLDPPPPDLTPTFRQSTSADGHSIWTADYRSAGGDGFSVWAAPQDPRTLPGLAEKQPSIDVTDQETVTVHGATAALVRGTYAAPSCTAGTASPEQVEPPPRACHHTVASLTWQRGDQWVQLTGEDTYSDATALVRTARSLVDRAQPVPLQLSLAPVGWSVQGFSDNVHLTLADDKDPSRSIDVSLVERWRGQTLENAFDPWDLRDPITSVTVDGQPARLAVVQDDTGAAFWLLAGQLQGQAPFTMRLPEDFTPEQIVAMADHVSYTP